MDIKVGSKEELDAEERLEQLRIASAERKWKAEMKAKERTESRIHFANLYHRTDGFGLLIFLLISFFSIIGGIALIANIIAK